MMEMNWRKEFGLTIEKKWEAKAQDGKLYHYVDGYASDQSLDRDGDRMSSRAIGQMKNFIDEGMNFYADHKHGLFDMLGVLTKAEERNGHLWVETRLEDPELNPQTKLFLHKLEIGEKIGLSIGGDLKKSHMDGNVRVIDDVVLYEISAVGIPSNANAYLLGSVYKNFEFKGPFAGRPGGAMGTTMSEEKPPSDWLDRCVEAVEETGTADEPYAVCTATWQRKGDKTFLKTLHPAILKSLTSRGLLKEKHERGAMCETVHPGEKHEDFEVKALKAETDSLLERVVKDAIRAYGEGIQNMGGKLPAAATSPGTGDDEASGKYPDKDTSVEPASTGVLKMSTKKEEHDELGGKKMPVPDAGTVAKLEEGKPSEKPGNAGEGTMPKASASTSVVSSESMGTGPSDKGSYSQTDDKDEEEIAKLEEDEEDEEDEEAKKAIHALIVAKKRKMETRKAKKFESDDFLSRIAAGKKAEEEARAWLARKDEGRAKLEEALGAPAVPPVAPSVAAPALSEDEDEEFKAMKGLVFGIFDKWFPGNTPQAADFKKEYEEQIRSVFQPKSGTENLTNLRSPGQPEAKIAAEPGKSGSSEVFRTDTGSKGGLEVLTDSEKNPPASLDTARKEPVATYETPTKLTSGTGYQMPLLRGVQSQNKGKLEGRTTESESFKTFKSVNAPERMSKGSFKALTEIESERMAKEFPRLKPVLLPKLKHIDPGRVPSQAEVEELIKSGKLSEDLVNPAPTTEEEYVYVDAKGNKRKSVLTKGIVHTFGRKSRE